MRKQRYAHLGARTLLLASAALASGCRERKAGPSVIQPAAETSDTSIVRPLPPAPPVDPRRAALGRKLFSDRRLSGDGTLSCASCHALDAGGADGRRRSVGVGGAVGLVNAPTVFNAAFNFRQFWDGRAATLEEQADGPITSPREMGGVWAEILAALARDDEVARGFSAAYPSGLSAANVRDAIATFEHTLVTPNSPFDRYLRGERGALGEQAERGYRLFVEYGCVSCHQGAGLGGNMYQRLGVMGDYFADRGGVTEADYGRYNATGREEDRFVFKVPSLRNVALTAPYFHDGAATTLDEAVRVMARYQLARSLDDGEAAALVAFLGSLTGERVGAP
jgi:cytochrome c peroxidase